MASDTEFGLASYFYSRDIGRIWRVAEALEYRIVGINEGIISAKSTGEIAGFGGSNRPPAFSPAGALKRPTFPSPRCRSHTRQLPMHLLGW